MAKKTTVWLITGFLLILIGFMILGGTMMALNWDFAKLFTTKYESNDYEIDGDFENISIDADTADITLAIAQDEKAAVSCYEAKNSKHSVTVKDNTLTITVNNTKKWYEYISIHWGTPRITVYLPKSVYTSLRIKESTGDIKITDDFQFETMDITASTGDIRVENISADTIDLSVSTGKVTGKSINCTGNLSIRVSTGDTALTDIRCKTLQSRGSTGDLSLNNVIAEETFSLERDTGDVIFKDCDAAELFITTTTGNVKGSLLSDKVFLAQTDTGKVDVPKTVTGGRCEITTDTGNIIMEIIS